ncbi:MAG: 2-amino-4-hydroxy-6-hydroxymethyldihydropteridine diphosphokinase [Marinosulfonomonas sp.]|nr:2-amino-4-hydroxy-6-hydroxymethyldihydropteridine diphosphokinase [Marinosulfonomonas sp.]
MYEMVVLGLGGNIASDVGEVATTIGRATADLSASGVDIITKSKLYETPCFPADAGPDFLNAALLCSTRLDPQALLGLIHTTETKYGRKRGARWSERTLDIDIIAIDGSVLPDTATFQAWHGLSLDQQKCKTPDQLIVPHPRLQDRAFVLVPMADVAPDWHHPILGLSVRRMLQQLPKPDLAAIRAVKDVW